MSLSKDFTSVRCVPVEPRHHPESIDPGHTIVVWGMTFRILRELIIGDPVHRITFEVEPVDEQG